MSQTPPYYGWVVLFVAAAAMVGTLPGRTQGLGLITEPLLADLDIGRVDYAQLNLWATLIGAAGAIGIGRFIDRVGSRVVLTVVAAALGVTVRADEPGHDICGTGGGRHVDARARTERAIGRQHRHGRPWFVRRIDMAMAIYSVALSVGFMMAFPVVGSLVQSRGWRVAWFAVGAAILAGLVPLAIAARAAQSRIDRPRDCRTGARSRSQIRRTWNPEPRNSEPEPGTRRLHAVRSASHTRLLGVRHRRGALRPGRIRHRIVQRIDPRRARLRARRLLSDPGHHRDDRARRKFHRRVARALRRAESIDGDLAARTDRRPPRAAARGHDGDGDGVGRHDGPRRRVW